jgi:aspartyl-tRNA(Asn)/glutamyl-tRNA(Gln) amidotransferase subunit C
MITKETVQHIAKLARLKLSEQEEQMYTEQLGKILDHVDALKAVDTTGVEPMFHALEIHNIMREDVVVPTPGQELILKGAPEAERGFFRVPKIGE